MDIQELPVGQESDKAVASEDTDDEIEGLINVTEMCVSAKKRLFKWKETRPGRRAIQKAEKKYPGEKVFKKKREGSFVATWAHPEIATELSKWLEKKPMSKKKPDAGEAEVQRRTEESERRLTELMEKVQALEATLNEEREKRKAVESSLAKQGQRLSKLEQNKVLNKTRPAAPAAAPRAK